MKTVSVVAALFAVANLAWAGSVQEPPFPLRHKHLRRAGHKHAHKRHTELPVVKRQSQCPFPTDVGLVAVTPNEQNAGWAMSPNQPCMPGSYCPFACPSGQVMAQWDPAATSYTYPVSMYGGLLCNEDGTMSKPFPNSPYCVEGVGSLIAINEASEEVSICQTVLPGNEAMLIPNSVPANGQLTLAVPDPSYWCSTSAEYYINIPGYDTTTACVWGEGSGPYGNWAPFVAGANQAASGDTFVMVGINPIYCCQSNTWPNSDPGFAVRIDCPSGNCNGMPCECDPSTMGANKCTGGTVGAGGAEFCTVTVPAGETANLVIWSTSGGSSGNGTVSVHAVSSNGQGSSVQPAAAPPAAPPPAPPPPASSSCSTSTSSTWVSPPASSARPPNHSKAASQNNQPYSAANNYASPAVASPSSGPAEASWSSQTSSSTTATSQPKPVIQQTSNSNRVTYTSTLLALTALVALFL